MSHGWHRQAGFIARCAMTTPEITLLFVERFCRAEPGGWAGSGHRARTGRAPSPPSITLGPRAPLALHFCGASVTSNLGAMCITWANAVGIGRLGARALSSQRCRWEVRRHSPGQAAGLEGHPVLIYAHRAHSDREDELSSLPGAARGHRAEAGGLGARGGAAVGGCCAGKANTVTAGSKD